MRIHVVKSAVSGTSHQIHTPEKIHLVKILLLWKKQLLMKPQHAFGSCDHTSKQV